MIMTLQYIWTRKNDRIIHQKKQDSRPLLKSNFRFPCTITSTFIIHLSEARKPSPPWIVPVNPKVRPKPFHEGFSPHWSVWRCEEILKTASTKNNMYCPSPSRISSRFQVVYQENMYISFCLLFFWAVGWGQFIQDINEMISKNKWMHIATNYFDTCPLSQYPSLRTINFTSRRIPLSDGQEIH